jgi:hypothetical protein
MTNNADKYGYEMLELTITIKKAIHVSCLVQTMDQVKAVGHLKSLEARYYVDNSPMFKSEVTP